jgi:type VI secretion system protein ImpF
VRRDLEWLLNTRCALPDLDEDHDALQASVYTYGLPDFSSFGAGAARTRSKLVRALRRAIASFEPRLSSVEVALIENEGEKHILRFLISGLLHMEPTSEPVVFDTQLDVSKGAYSVQED